MTLDHLFGIEKVAFDGVIYKTENRQVRVRITTRNAADLPKRNGIPHVHVVVMLHALTADCIISTRGTGCDVTQWLKFRLVN